MKTRRHDWKAVTLRWWPTLLTLLAVLWLTLAPDPVPDTGVTLFPNADKVVHAIMMGGLASALFFDYRRPVCHVEHALTWRKAAMLALCVAIFAAIDEWAQGAMAIGRTSDFHDLLADWAGIILATVSVPPMLNKYFGRRNN